MGSRMKREKKTVLAMVSLYCHNHHGTQGVLCQECSKFLIYAETHLDRCPFQEDKPTCANCSIHCYQSEMSQKAKAIMRYSGPRMLFRHPILALHHTVDGFKKTHAKQQLP